MFIRRVNINNLKSLLIELEFRRYDTAIHVRIMANNFNRAPRVKEEAHPGWSLCAWSPKCVTAPLSLPQLTLRDIR